MAYRSRIIYHNNSVLAPDGTEIFRCDEKKLNWYLSRGLAVLVSKDPPTIQLNFEPNGMGWSGENFYLQNRENLCCVCGTSEFLTKHHVVPHAYRKHLPVQLKESNYYDVLPCCETCHSAYEKIAQDRKRQLANKYQAPLNGIHNRITEQHPKWARSVLFYGHVMPPERKAYLLSQIAIYLDKTEVTEEDLKSICVTSTRRRRTPPPDFRSHGELVMSKVENPQTFVEEWRAHFVETMKPRFLPNDWEVNRDIFGRKQSAGGNNDATI